MWPPDPLSASAVPSPAHRQTLRPPETSHPPVGTAGLKNCLEQHLVVSLKARHNCGGGAALLSTACFRTARQGLRARRGGSASFSTRTCEPGAGSWNGGGRAGRARVSAQSPPPCSRTAGRAGPRRAIRSGVTPPIPASDRPAHPVHASRRAVSLRASLHVSIRE